MATVYGANATKRDNQEPTDKIDPGEVRGRLRTAYDSYEAAGVLTSGDIIKMFKLPEGAKVYDCGLKTDDLGTAGDLSVGWEAGGDETADANGLLDSIAADSQSHTLLSANSASPGHLKKFTDEVQVSITVETTTTAAGTIELWCTYAET